jgi:hypothetical protein
VTDAKLLRFAAVLIVLAGYSFIFRTGEARIAERRDGNARIAEQLGADIRTTALRAALIDERARLRKRLRLADASSDRSTTVARFLRDAAALATSHRTAISAVTATGASAAVPATGATGVSTAAAVPGSERGSPAVSSEDPFDAIPLDMTVEGRYGDVLATVRALSADRVLATVDVTSLVRKNAAAPDATLTAALRVVLERLGPVPGQEQAGVRPRSL